MEEEEDKEREEEKKEREEDNEREKEAGEDEKDSYKDNKQTNKIKQKQSTNPRQYLLRHYSVCSHTVTSTAVSADSESTPRNLMTAN